MGMCNFESGGMNNGCDFMPAYVVKVITVLRDAGFQAYAVGGCIRDTVIGKKPSDWDVSTSAKPEEMLELFEKTIPTGIHYGTVTVIIDKQSVEVTTFRLDGEYKDGRKPDSVVFVSDIIQDLSRRDFTMNAMAMGPDGEVIDPYGGRRDISLRIIRCVGDPDVRFSEDALRMLRALRFAAVLNFDIHADILKSIEKLAPLAEQLSPERVRDELEKVLMSRKPELAEDMINYRLLSKYILPGKVELSPIASLPQDNEIRWCAFSFLVSSAGQTRFSVESLLRELRLPGKIVQNANLAAKIAEQMPCDGMGIRMLIAMYGEKCVELAAWCAEASGKKGTMKNVRKEISLRLAVSVQDLDIDGNLIKNLGFSGKEIGMVLKWLSSEATLGKVKNNRGDLLAKAETLTRREKNGEGIG